MGRSRRCRWRNNFDVSAEQKLISYGQSEGEGKHAERVKNKEVCKVLLFRYQIFVVALVNNIPIQLLKDKEDLTKTGNTSNFQLSNNSYKHCFNRLGDIVIRTVYLHALG
jgi:hypothetical protein